MFVLEAVSIWSKLLIIIVDIDECGTMTDTCDMNAICSNTPGSFTCVCGPGYSGDGINCLGKYHLYQGCSRPEDESGLPK